MLVEIHSEVMYSSFGIIDSLPGYLALENIGHLIDADQIEEFLDIGHTPEDQHGFNHGFQTQIGLGVFPNIPEQGMVFFYVFLQRVGIHDQVIFPSFLELVINTKLSATTGHSLGSPQVCALVRIL